MVCRNCSRYPNGLSTVCSLIAYLVDLVCFISAMCSFTRVFMLLLCLSNGIRLQSKIINY